MREEGGTRSVGGSESRASPGHVDLRRGGVASPPRRPRLDRVLEVYHRQAGNFSSTANNILSLSSGKIPPKNTKQNQNLNSFSKIVYELSINNLSKAT